MSQNLDHIRKRLKDAGYFANREVQEAIIELDERLEKLENAKSQEKEKGSIRSDRPL